MKTTLKATVKNTTTPNIVSATNTPLKAHPLSAQSAKQRIKERGLVMGMAELIAVIVIGGIISATAAAYFSDVFKMADSSYLWETSERLAHNWRLATQKCQVSSVIGTSPIVTTPSAPNHLTMLVEGTGVANRYQGCFQSSGVEPARNAGIRGTGGVYTAQGYAVTIANQIVNNRNRIAITFTQVEDATVLELVQTKGGQANASSFINLPADDVTDPVVRFVANGAGYHDVTILK
jgi:hypothetical protein